MENEIAYSSPLLIISHTRRINRCRHAAIKSLIHQTPQTSFCVVLDWHFATGQHMWMRALFQLAQHLASCQWPRLGLSGSSQDEFSIIWSGNEMTYCASSHFVLKLIHCQAVKPVVRVKPAWIILGSGAISGWGRPSFQAIVAIHSH